MEINQAEIDPARPETLCYVKSVILFGSLLTDSDDIGDVDICVSVATKPTLSKTLWDDVCDQLFWKSNDTIPPSPIDIATKYIQKRSPTIKMVRSLPGPTAQRVLVADGKLVLGFDDEFWR